MSRAPSFILLSDSRARYGAPVAQAVPGLTPSAVVPPAGAAALGPIIYSGGIHCWFWPTVPIDWCPISHICETARLCPGLPNPPANWAKLCAIWTTLNLRGNGVPTSLRNPVCSPASRDSSETCWQRGGKGCPV